MNSNMGRWSSFRENDDAFLQKQTRIWLGEVLGTRFDEQVDISDLLADGELLCEVSKVFWNSFWHLKEKLKGPIALRKRGGRYTPYSNVDSFLKICKIFGLDGVDLFSPSDVVEKKNTRQVCICIRALSKKAQLKRLHLPDFDKVTPMLATPDDMVESLRKSLAFSNSVILGTNCGSPIFELNSDLDIYPTGCVSPQGFYQYSSSKLVETACITTNQECQQPVVGNLSEFRGDMDNEHSRIQPQRNLFSRFAIGTAIVGVLLFLLRLSKRVGDVDGKLVMKSGPMQNYSHSKFKI